jgi:hypothetical protein
MDEAAESSETDLVFNIDEIGVSDREDRKLKK